MRRFLIATLCITFAGCSPLVALNENSSETHSSLASESSLRVEQPKTRVKIDEEWDLYTNTQMKFSMQIPHTLMVIADKKNNYADIGIGGTSWPIYSKDVPQKSDLDSIIKNLLGAGCYIKKTSNWQNTSVKMLEVTADGDLSSSKKCKARESAWLTLYSEELKMAVFFSLGQEYAFDRTGEKDVRMINSIRLQ